ncbi:hypothetical protein C5C07_15445 [Haloferax sp. Atlit-4N]|uniref:hypothetical protein n=1 Tax=Haloferax sp. Atlit-4N TaxID=2077206 RepID=UPI000E233360|nr:hypothetical protein [Haloferax sp. Atlit-4N]RDZ53128.1 hypothetical protein C5C07_15445 [Haloferax sp. Atlit-4N]
MTVHELFNSGIAALAHDPEDALRVHGVVLGEGDVTNGLSGKQTRWPADILESMVDLLEGKPITMADSLDPEQHVGVEKTDDGARATGAVTMEEKVGEITAAAYEPGVGLLFEGFVSDWDAEDVVERGLAQVSPVIVRELDLVEGEAGEDDALYEPTAVSAVRDLAIVADGAAPSNDIAPGPSADMTATAAALTSNFDVQVEALADGGLEVTNTGGDDGQDGGNGQSTPARGWRASMTEDNLTDKERELLAVAAQADDPVVAEASELERLDVLDDNEELIETAAELDDPKVESADELEAMRRRLETVESMFDEALTEQRGLRETTVEAMSFEAKASEFETDGGDLDVEALTQNPESGSSSSSGGGSGGPSEEDRERIQQISEKLDTVGNMLPDSRVEALQDEAATLAGTDDYDGALEVL